MLDYSLNILDVLVSASQGKLDQDQSNSNTIDDLNPRTIVILVNALQ